MNIGTKIKEARCLSGLTQEELAALVGLNGKMAISRLETGSRRPDFEVVARIATATGCPLSWFAGSEDDGEPVRKPEEIELLELFSHLTLLGREYVLKCLHCTYAAEKLWSASMRAEA